MPRVNRDNRDLQRRLAARRDRVRRRPSGEPRYSFAPADTVETPADSQQDLVEGSTVASPATAAAATRSTGNAARPSGRSFAEHREEYAYVARDLRRLA